MPKKEKDQQSDLFLLRSSMKVREKNISNSLRL